MWLSNYLKFWKTLFILQVAGGGGGGQTQTQKTEPWAGAQPYLSGQGGVLPEARRIYGQQAELAPYSGQLAARPTETTLSAQNLARGMVPGIQSTGQQISDYGSNVLGGQYLDVASNPALMGYMEAATNPLKQQLMEEILPSISSGAVASGGYGGSRQGIAQAQGIERYLQQAMDTRARMAGEAYTTERGFQQAAPQLLAQGQQMQMWAPEVLANIGAQEQAAEQALLDEAYQLDQFSRMQPWQPLAQYAGLVSPAAGYGGTSTGTMTPEANPLGGAAGGAMAGSYFGPWGTAIGAGLGYAASL